MCIFKWKTKARNPLLTPHNIMLTFVSPRESTRPQFGNCGPLTLSRATNGALKVLCQEPGLVYCEIN